MESLLAITILLKYFAGYPKLKNDSVYKSNNLFYYLECRIAFVSTTSWSRQYPLNNSLASNLKADSPGLVDPLLDQHLFISPLPSSAFSSMQSPGSLALVN